MAHRLRSARRPSSHSGPAIHECIADTWIGVLQIRPAVREDITEHGNRFIAPIARHRRRRNRACRASRRTWRRPARSWRWQVRTFRAWPARRRVTRSRSGNANQRHHHVIRITSRSAHRNTSARCRHSDFASARPAGTRRRGSARAAEALAAQHRAPDRSAQACGWLVSSYQIMRQIDGKPLREVTGDHGCADRDAGRPEPSLPRRTRGALQPGIKTRNRPTALREYEQP